MKHKRNHTGPAAMFRSRFAYEPLENRRLMSAGNLDPTFGGDGKVEMYWPDLPGIPLSITDTAIQNSSGKIVVVGHRSGNPAAARFNSDGTLDTSFGNQGVFQWPTSELINGTMTRVSAVAIQADGKIVAAGQAHRLFTLGKDPEDYFAVARLHSNGTPDLSWGDSGVHVTGFEDEDQATDVIVQKDGKILAVGYARIGIGTGDYDFVAARYNPNGVLDNTFSGNGKVEVNLGHEDVARSVTVDYSGTPTTNPRYGGIVIGGTVSNNEVSRFALARLTSSGSLDNSFDGNGMLTTIFPGDPTADGNAVVVQPTGKIVIAGSIYSAPGSFGMARYHANGSIDLTFGSGGSGTVRTWFPEEGLSVERATGIAMGFDGGLVVSGPRAIYGDYGFDRYQFAIAAYTSEGLLDPRFSGDGMAMVDMAGSIQSVAIATTNDSVAPIRRIVVAGGFGMARLVDVGPVISISSSDPEASEAGPDPATFTVFRDKALPTSQRVYLNISGTAVRPNTVPIGHKPGADYTGVGVTFVIPVLGASYVDIPAFADRVTVQINPVDDTAVEGDEHAVFTIAPGVGYDVGMHSSTTLVIRDNDVSAPAVVSSSFNTETAPHRLIFQFSQNVSASFSAADVSVQNLTSGQAVPISSIAHDTVLNKVTVTLNGILSNGQYRATLNAPGITNTAGLSLGTNHAIDFSFLAGDANGDGKVDVADLGIFASNWQKSGRTFSQGNFDYSPDGVVGVNDLGILASNWQQQAAAPAASSAGLAAGARKPADGKRIAIEVL